MHGDALHRALDALHPRVGMEHDLRVGQALEQDGGGFGVLAGEEAVDVEHADMGAEHAVRLAELEPDRTAAEHDEMLDALADVEDGLVGEIGHLVEAGDRRNGRRGPGGDDESAGAHQHAAGLHRELVEEARLRLDHAHAQAGHALDRIVRRDRGDDAMHVIVDAAMVDLGLDHVDAEGGGGAHGVGALAGGEQGLGRDAAIIETVAAHAPLLDEHHGHAELGRGGRDRQTS